MLQPSSKIVAFVMIALVATASAAYLNIGVQSTPQFVFSNYYLSIDNDIFGYDLSFNFFNDNLSLSIITPYIFFGQLELGYKIYPDNFSTFNDGVVYLGLCETLRIDPFRLRLKAQLDTDMNFRMNGEIGIGF